MGFIDDLRKKRDREAQLAQQMSHIQQQEFYNPVGDALTALGRGVRERVTHPLATLAGEAQRWTSMSPDMAASEVAGMLNPSLSGFAGITRQTKNIPQLEKDVIDAMKAYEASKASGKQVDSNVLDTLIKAGAFGGGVGLGYYGMNQMMGE